MPDGPPSLEQLDARRWLSSILVATSSSRRWTQEPFQSRDAARAGRSESAAPLVRCFPKGVRSRLAVLLLRLPSRHAPTSAARPHHARGGPSREEPANSQPDSTWSGACTTSGYHCMVRGRTQERAISG